jgi:hypothetical protein
MIWHPAKFAIESRMGIRNARKEGFTLREDFKFYKFGLFLVPFFTGYS